MTDNFQRCGNCGWFDVGQSQQWGWCRYEIPLIPFPMPIQCSLDQDAGWRDLEISDGVDCPTWKERR